MTALHPARLPVRRVLEGRYARLEPLAPHHAQQLFEAATVGDAMARFAFLPGDPPASLDVIADWIARSQGSDPIPFAVIDKATGRAEGWQQFMRIEAQHGVIEIGNVLRGPAIARTRAATEALYLFAREAFDELGYRRFEWKCNDRNEPSKAAARRFGFTFEGVFRQHMIVKGANRDTAWFAMLDGDWPSIRVEFERWLDPANFDTLGRQLSPLRPGASG